MNSDPRIEWCRENIPGFKAMHDQAEKARLDTEENRKRMAVHMGAGHNVGVLQGETPWQRNR